MSSSDKNPPAPSLPDVMRWLTRDADDQGLGNIIDVWLERPQMHRLPGGGVMWLGPNDSGVEAREMSCTVDYAATRFRTLPETARECIVFY